MSYNITELHFQIVGLDCPDCARSLESAVSSLPGVARAELTFATARLVVTSERADSDLEHAVTKLAASMGHDLIAIEGSHGIGVPDLNDTSSSAWRSRVRRDGDILLAAMLLSSGLIAQAMAWPTWLTQILLVAAILTGARRVVRAAWIALRTARTLDMNALMTIAVVGALVLGEYAEGAMTILLFSVGEWLEGYSADRVRRAIRALMALAPAEATRLVEGHEERIPVQALHIGERILVRPGERIAMDGEIVEGHSAVNQAPITGESAPVEKQPGADVYAGSINGNGSLVIRITKRSQDNTLSRILSLVEKAQSERAPAQRFVDAFARIYTPIVIAAAVLVASIPPLFGLGALREWFYRSLVLLVIACPCALVISTPVTIVSALARAARSGVLIKGGRHLEMLAKVRAIAFDKTGTLTLGNMHVVGGACTLHPELDENCNQCRELLAKASAVETRSEHLLAQAIVAHADTRGLNGRYAASEQVTAYPGLGVTGSVEGHEIAVGSHSFLHRDQSEAEDAFCQLIIDAERQGYTVLVAKDECCDQQCFWTVSDSLRPEAPQAVDALRRLGLERLVVLTGDNPRVTARVTHQAGIDEFYAALLPEQKLALIERMQQEWGAVAMVGDGINDAPALAKASVGIAMGQGGADAAIETADVTLMGDDLMRPPFALGLSRRALRIVRANIAFALSLKAAFMLLALAGISTLWMAVLADTGAALLVTLNGLRLLAHREAAS